MYARHRALQPQGRSVLKISSQDSSRYPLSTLFPGLTVFPEGDSSGSATYITIAGPTVDQVNAATMAYLGGHIYYVDDAEAARLIAAGYTVTPDAADTAPPVLKILEPSSHAIIEGLLTITVSAPTAVAITGKISGGGGGITGGGGLPFNFESGSSTISFSTGGFGGGTYRITITARDAAFNSSSAFVDIILTDPPAPVTPTILPSPTLLPSTELIP